MFMFVESYRRELQAVKGVQSKNFLARKGVLLDAAVSEGIEGQRALGRVLQVDHRNIGNAIVRRVGLDVLQHYNLLERAKRAGLTDYVKEKVRLWTCGGTTSPGSLSTKKMLHVDGLGGRSTSFMLLIILLIHRWVASLRCLSYLGFSFLLDCMSPTLFTPLGCSSILGFRLC